MIRIFARRPLLFSALTMCAGAGLVLTGYYDDNSVAFIVIMLMLCLTTMLAFVAEFLGAKVGFGKRFTSFMSKNKFLWLLLLATYVIGGLLCDAKLRSFEDILDTDAQYYVVGTVISVDEYSTVSYVLLQNVKIEFDGTQRKLLGKTRLQMRGEVAGEIQKGQTIGFSASNFASKYQSVEKLSTYELVKDIHYVGFATIGSGNSIDYINSKKSPADVVHNRVLDHLVDQMPQDIAYLSYSVLFGDSDYLSDMTNTSFKISGVMHIVAVSGMNVVFIISIILMCLRFIKRKRFLKFCIITAVLVFYCYLCDYTPSVVRATIMGLVVLSAKNIGRQGDILSSLGFSCILILFIWPMSILDAGFLMSFACVVGIVFFCEPLTKFFKKYCKFPNWLATGMAMTISSQIGIYPIMAEYFNCFSIYSVLANIVVVPVFSLAYILLFASLLVVLIFPFMAFTLKFSAVPMSFVYWFPSLFVGLPLASVYVFEMGWLTVLYYVAMVIISSFVFIHHDYRFGLSIVLITCIIAILVLSNVPKTYKKDTLTELTDGCYIVTTSCNEKILFGVAGRNSAENYVEVIQRKRINTLNAVIVYDSTDPYDTRSAIEFLQSKLTIKQIVVDKSVEYAYDSMKNKPTNGVATMSADGISYYGAKLSKLYHGNNYLMTVLDLDDFSIVVLPDNLSELDLLYARNILNTNAYLYYNDDSYSKFLPNYKRLNATI